MAAEELVNLTHRIVGPLVCATALLAAGCGKQSSTNAANPPQMPPALVTAAVATGADVPVYLDEIGKSAAFESVTVTPQLAGRVTERRFQDGAELSKGQLLFVIDPRPFQAQMDSAKAQLAQAKAALDLAQSQLKMYASIIDTRAVSQLDYETKKSTVQVDQAQVQAAEAAVENAQLNLDYCYIHAPIDGRAGARMVDIGNVVQANSTPLLLIQHLDPIYADFTITEADLPEVQREMMQGILKTLVRLPSDQDTAGRAGSLNFVDNAVQDQTGTVKLRATIPNKDYHFWPGQFVNVRLVLAVQKNAVLIPSSAAQISQKGPYVYVVQPDSTALLTPIKLGQRQGDLVVVESGLKPGDQIVTAGFVMIMDHGKVMVMNGPPGGAPAGHAPPAQSKGESSKSASARNESNGGSL